MPCIPGRRNRKVSLVYDTKLYRQRHRIENMFAELEDWRRVYDHCAHTFVSAIVMSVFV